MKKGILQLAIEEAKARRHTELANREYPIQNRIDPLDEKTVNKIITKLEQEIEEHGNDNKQSIR